MGVNISGKGVLSGLASLVAGAFNLLATKIIGYTKVGGGGSSYYTTRVESTVDAVVGSADYALWRSLDKGKNWEVLPSNTYFSRFAYFKGKYYAIQPYNSPGFAFTSNLSGISSDWSSVILPNDEGYLSTSVDLDNMFTYFDQGLETLAIHKSKNLGNNVYETKLWTTTNGSSWTEEIIPTASSVAVIAKNDRIFYIDSFSKTIHSKYNGTWYSETYSPNFGPYDISPDNVFGSNLYLLAESGGQYSIVKYGPNCELVGTDSIQLVSEYGQQGNIATFLIDPISGQLVIISIISEGSNNHFYRTTNYGQNWTKTATIAYNNQFGQLSIDGYFEYIDSLNTIIVTRSGNGNNICASSSDSGQTWTVGNVNSNFSFYSAPQDFRVVPIKTLVETQISIGDQGSDGAEILAPIDVYTVPPTKTTNIDQITIKNNSANTITYDLAVLDAGIQLTDQNSIINDQVILAGETATITSITTPMTLGQRIVVFPSAVDVVEVKVYGTES